MERVEHFPALAELTRRDRRQRVFPPGVELLSPSCLFTNLRTDTRLVHPVRPGDILVPVESLQLRASGVR